MPLAGKSALIVADSPFGAPYLAARLAVLGAGVTRVARAAAALAILGKQAPHVVIVDCAIGEAVTRRLAETAREKGVGKSLILFSPYERRSFGEAVIKDFDGWLVKPVRSSSLDSRLKTSACSEEYSKNIAKQIEVGKPLEGRKILVAEDNDVNAMLVERTLSRLGAHIVRARDGAEAVALACDNAEKFDTVLMDVRMPCLDGLAAARQIRMAENESGAARVRIVALTADVSDADRAAAFEAGMDLFMAKSVDLMEIIRVIAPEIML
jgi:CheY-like chemotaxis protein